MKYEVAQHERFDRTWEGETIEYDWRVEAVDHEANNETYLTVFSGHRDEERAREYASWKNGEKAPAPVVGARPPMPSRAE